MNFNKHFREYDDYSYIQKKVAKDLVEYMKEKHILDKQILSIFEIGCGTGVFTKEYLKNFKKLEQLFLNDKYDVREYIKDIEYEEFLEGDIFQTSIPEVDLVVSSSVFQWIENLDKLIGKIISSSKILCFSTYILGNLIEIKNHFGISLDYKKMEEIEDTVSKYFKQVHCYKKTVKLEFESPIEVLRHLKYTGVTGIQKPKVTNIRSFKEKTITYEVAYFICRN